MFVKSITLCFSGPSDNDVYVGGGNYPFVWFYGGEPITNNWAPGKPGQPPNIVVMMSHEYGYKYVDVPFTQKAIPLCESD